MERTDTSGAEVLVEHAGFLRGIVAALLADRDAVEDVVQDTWVVAIERPPARGSSLRDWLAGVARNLVRQRGRSAARRARNEVRAAKPEGLPSAGEQASRLDLLGHVVRVLRSLDEPYRSTLFLRYYDGLPPREIARRQGAPIATVKTRLRRGLERIRAELDEKGGPEGWRRALLPLPLGPAPATGSSPAGESVSEAAATAAVPASAASTASSLPLGAALLVSLLVVAGAVLVISRGRGPGATPTPGHQLAVTDPIAPDPSGADAAQPAPLRSDSLGVADAGPAGGAPPVAAELPFGLRGTIEHAEGGAFGGAKLRAVVYRGAYGPSIDPSFETELEADAEGAFFVAIPSPEEIVRIRLTSDETAHVSSGRSFVLLPGDLAPEPFVVSMFPTTGRITGTITASDGSPLAGAMVWSTGDDRRYREATSDEQGRYVLPVSPVDDRPALYAYAAGYGLAYTTLSLSGDGEGRFDFRLEPEVVVRGRVVDPQGLPIAGADVIGHTERAVALAGRDRTTTGADGRFELGGFDPRGGMRSGIRVYAGGHVPSSFPFPDSGLDVEGEVALERAVSFAGRLLDPEGEPVPRARVLLVPTPVPTRRFAESRTLTGLDGRFRFAAVVAGEHRLEIDSTAGPVLRAVTAPGDVTITLGSDPSRSFAGTVHDDAGEPIENAHVSFGSGEARVSTFVRTDAEGRFHAGEVPEAFTRIRVGARGFVEQSEWIRDLLPGDLRFELRRAVVLTGRVVDDDTGKPIRTFRVRLFTAYATEDHASAHGLPHLWTSADGRAIEHPSGVFETEPTFDAGSVIGIEVDAEGYGPARVDSHVIPADPDPDSLLIRLRRAGALAGVVLDAQTGDPVEGARVKLFNDENRLRSDEAYYEHNHRPATLTTTGEDGRFRIDGISPGEHSVAALHEAYAVGLAGPFRIDAGAEPVECELRLSNGSKILGRLVDVSGNPVPDTRVGASTSDARGIEIRRGTRTDREGRFSFEHLLAGDYRVSRQKERGETRLLYYLTLGPSETRDLFLDPVDGTGRIVVHLPPSTSERPRVVGLWEHQAYRLPYDERRPARHYDVTGEELVIEGVAAGEYHVSAHRLRGPGPIVVVEGGTTEVTLEPIE